MLIAAVVPSMAKSIQNMASAFPQEVNNLIAWVDDFTKGDSEFADMVSEGIETASVMFQNFMDKELLPLIQTYIASITTGVINGLKVLLNALVGVIVSVYVLASKDTFAGQAKKVIYAIFKPARANVIIDTVRKSGGVIIADKGATFYAIAVSVVKLCRMILSSENSVTTISTMMHGEYGLRDVCVSVSCLVGPNGVEKRIVLPLTDEEVEKLKASAAVMHEMVEHIYGEEKQ